MEPLTGEAVHCWIVPPPLVRSDALNAAGILTPDEQARGARFHFEVDRRLYLASHVALRLLLARYTGCAPDALPIAVEANGRPFLTGVLSRLHFNLSHSGEMALAAFALSDPVGVDVERVRKLPDAIEIAERYFAAGEREAIRRAPAERRSAVFAVIWTRKEAILKALGLGLHAPLDSFETGAPDGAACVTGEATEWRGWTVTDLAPAPGYLGAVAIQRERAPLVVREFSIAGF
jgi:4'-phosphopantetheinyl transferase